MSNIESETQNVISALSTIYTTTPNTPNNSTTNTREQANQYLTQYQRNPIAWEISNRLLSTLTTNDVTIQTQIFFFAAQTLHTKCRSDMLQLPSSSWASLRDSIMNHLVRFCEEVNKGNNAIAGGAVHAGGATGAFTAANVGGSNAGFYRPVISRLAMALCALSVQMEWYDVVDQLILGSSSNQDGIPNDGYMNVVLEMAQLLPEETTNYRLLIQTKSIREGFIQSLIDKSTEVFQFFYKIVCHVNKVSTVSGADGGAGGIGTTNKNIKIKEQILKCIHAWVRYINVPPQLLQETPLVNWAFSILASYDINNNQDDGDTFELAVDVVIEILRCYPSENGSNVRLMHKMIPLVMSLAQNRPHLQQQQNVGLPPFQKALQNQDEDGMRAYCRIFTEMGESYMSFIMDGQDQNQVYLVDLVLSCSALPDHGECNVILCFQSTTAA